MNLVLLTATVTPNVSEQLVISDSRIRLLQYQDSVKEWYRALTELGFDLAIVETSDAAQSGILSKLSPSERSSVAYFNYRPVVGEVKRGKGAIEMAAIEHAITEHTGLDFESTVYKCTGRLPLLNATRCIEALGPNSVRARMTLDRSWADTRLFGTTVRVWKDLLFASAASIDDSRGIYFERAVASRISAGLALGEIMLNRFPMRPIFSGVSGTSGLRYSPAFSRARDLLLLPLENSLAKLAARKQV